MIDVASHEESMTRKTKRRKQCAKCPWKVSTNPHDIPNGYCPGKHKALKSTIADPGLVTLSDRVPMMACHESPVGKEEPCCGWLAQQLGPGNNIALRLLVMSRRDLTEFDLDGPQHETLEDTLPME